MVLAGYIGLREEYTVMGDTVNVARRLEQNADPGTVLIGETTYQLVRGIYKLRRLPPLQVKGKKDVLSAFLVEGLITQPSKVRYRSPAGLETIMVGRDPEMERLFEFYDQAMASDTPTLVLVTGEAGIGKSRLLMEFTSSLEVEEPSVIVMSARALAQASRIPFFLWKSLFHNRFGLNDGDTLDENQAKFLKGIELIWGPKTGAATAEEAAHFIGRLTGLKWLGSEHLAGFEEAPEARVRRTFDLTRELLRRASADCPLVILLDDLHWADAGSVDLLTHLLQPGPEPFRLLVLAGARPELLTKQSRWANMTRVITLKPLEVSSEMVSEAYPDLRQMAKTVLAELAWRSDGNPYFLEELVKSLVKSGLIQPGLPEEEIIDKLRAQPPESLRALLQARLDGLYVEAREVLLLASVIGRVFWVGAVLEAAEGSQQKGTGFLMQTSSRMEDLIHDALQQLEWAELVFPRAGTKFSDDQEYIFKHSLLRDVAYNLLPHKYRKQHHLAVARWLARRRDPDFRVMMATHLEKAQLFEEAAQQYEVAAREAEARGAAQEAAWLLAQANQLREK
jgi:predicted ATPase